LTLKSLSEILKVHRNSISQSGSCIGSVRVHSYTPRSMWYDSRAFSWSAPLQPLGLSCEPKARVMTLSFHMAISRCKIKHAIYFSHILWLGFALESNATFNFCSCAFTYTCQQMFLKKSIVTKLIILHQFTPLVYPIFWVSFALNWLSKCSCCIFSMQAKIHYDMVVIKATKNMIHFANYI